MGTRTCSMVSRSRMVTALSAGVCGYVIPGRELQSAVRAWRFVLTICAALAGLFGVTAGLIALLLHLGSIKSFGRGYLRPFDRATTGGVILRRRLKTQAERADS